MSQKAYAYVESDGEIDLASIAETEDGVKERCLESWMGWRYEHPNRYNQNETWAEILKHGQVVPITIEKTTA